MANHDDEVRALTRAAGAAFSGVVRTAGGIHAAVTHRVCRSLPRAARPVARVQGALAAGIYSAVGAGRLAPPVLAEVVGALAPGLGAAQGRSPGWQTVWCAANGLYGDRLAASAPWPGPVATVRDGRADVAVEPRAVAAAFPGATSRWVVFLPGLGESDLVWGRGSGPRYGDVLRADGITPVYLRYNSGLPVAVIGAAVSQLLQRLCDAWPGPVERIDLVGHSMGGLVARSACRPGPPAEPDGRSWLRLVHTVVTLGTPHRGAPLARGVDVLEDLLRRLAETRPLAGVLGARSPGIRDLGSGPGPDAAALPHASYRYLAATLGADAGHPVGRWLGDGLVQPSSALDRDPGSVAPAGAPTTHHLGGTHHFRLLDHPEVLRLLRDWSAHDSRSRRRGSPGSSHAG